MSSTAAAATNAPPPEFTIDTADIVRLVLGWLTSMGFHTSARVLRDESGVGFVRGLLNPSTVVNQCRQGDWGSVLQALYLCQDTSFCNSLLQEQIILELANEEFSSSSNMGENNSNSHSLLSLAYSVLRVHRDELDRVYMDEDDSSQPQPQQKSNNKNNLNRISMARSLEQRLAQLASNPSKYSEQPEERRKVLFGTTTSKQQRRNKVADTVEQTLRQVPKDRLPILIQQAIKWQAYTGQLPFVKEIIHSDDERQQQESTTSQKKKKKKRKKRKHFDLVMGDVTTPGVVVGDSGGENVNDDDDDDEPVTQDVYQKVKFGKSAVCESALFIPPSNVGASGGLITGSSDGLIEVWDSSYSQLNTSDYPYQSNDQVMGHSNPVLALAVSNDGDMLASGDATGKVKVWKLATGKCLRQYQAHANAGITCLALSRDATKLLTGSTDGICREFGLVTQHVLQEYHGHSSYLQSCEYVLAWTGKTAEDSSRGDETLWVVTGSADGTVRFWQKGQCLTILQPTTATMSSKSSLSSLVVDPTQILPESPGIVAVIPIGSHKNSVLIVPRSSCAYRVDMGGTVLQTYRATEQKSSKKKDDDGIPIFCAASVSTSWYWVYLVTTHGDLLIFHVHSGKCKHVLRDFAKDSTAKTSSGGESSSSGAVEVTQLIHHPIQSTLLAAYSNDKKQKKGVLTVWK